MAQAYKSRSFVPAFVDEVDAEATRQADQVPGAKVKSTPEMLEIAWHFYMEHKDGL